MVTQQHKVYIYRELINWNLDSVASELSSWALDQDNDSCARLAMQSLLYYLQGKHKFAESALEKAEAFQGECDTWSKARVLEANIQMKLLQKRNLKEVASIAKEAITLDNNAVIAKNNLAQIYFIQGSDDKGEALCMEILATYPEAKWVYKNLAYYLIRAKRYPDARKYISRISPKSSQLIYRFMQGYIRYVYLFFAGLVLSPILFSFRVVLGIYILLAILDAALMLYGHRRPDGFVRRVFTTLLVFHGIFFTIYLVGMLMIGYSIHDLFFGLY